MRWIVRCKTRFSHRVVLLIDSKVFLGAITKGRSSSRALNTLVRRAAALSFAAGLVLHCVFVSTKHNPADWPSRGDRSTWPAALRERSYRPAHSSRCPDCGLLPKDHPRHLPRRERGQPASFRNCCDGGAGGYAYDFDSGVWVPYHVLYARHLKSSCLDGDGQPKSRDAASALRFLDQVLADDSE